MTDKKVKCTDCGELMNDIDEFGCCFSCDLIARFSDHLHSALGIEEGDLIGKHAELATELVEMARDRILKRVVFQQRPSAEVHRGCLHGNGAARRSQ